MSIRKKFDDTALEIGVAFKDDAAELSALFKTIEQEMPVDQKDDMIAQLKAVFSGDNLADFIADDENTLALYAAVEGRIIGGLMARYVNQDEHAQGHWDDPQEHMQLLWYGVAPEARGAVYSTPQYKISTALFAFLKYYADDEFGCSHIETLNHVGNEHGRKTLRDNGFLNMGAVLANLDMDNITALPHSSARHYERFRLSLSRRVLN